MHALQKAQCSEFAKQIKKFNTDPSVRFKRTAIIVHSTSQQHKSSIEAKLTRRSSSFHKQVKQREQSREDVYHNVFLTLYWLAKEELPKKKFISLLDLTERLGQVDMKFFQRRSGGAVREMFLLGKMVKAGVVEKMKQANTFGLLTDEVCDITNIAQLVTFIKFVDVNFNQATTQFIATDDLLKDSSSVNATTNKNTVMKQLHECGLDVKTLSGLATDGCSVMIGKRNGVSSQLRQKSPLLLNVHCVCHRLALACGDANNDVSYICTVEKILIQLWSFFDHSAKRTAAYGKAVMAIKEINLSAKGRKKWQRASKRRAEQDGCRWRRRLMGCLTILRHYVKLCASWRTVIPLATGLLNQIANIKFLSTVYVACSTTGTCSPKQSFSRRQCFFCSYHPSYQVHR